LTTTRPSASRETAWVSAKPEWRSARGSREIEEVSMPRRGSASRKGFSSYLRPSKDGRQLHEARHDEEKGKDAEKNKRRQHRRRAPAEGHEDLDRNVLGHHENLAPAKNSRRDVEAEREDEDEKRGGDKTRFCQGKVDPPESLPARRPKAA